MKFFLSILFIFTLSVLQLDAQQLLPLEIKVYGGFQQPIGFKRVDSGNGFTLGSQLAYTATANFNIHFDVSYDYTALTQSDVLDEWDWDYWEETYIPFLPAVNLEEVNRTLRYDDGERSAVFKPEQNLKELKLALGAAYQLALTDNFSGFLQFDFGVSNYTRELRMNESWTRQFELPGTNPDGSLDTTQYNYTYELLHFAPAKTGWRFFIAPVVGATYHLSTVVDLFAETKYVYYLKRDQVQWLEDFFNIPAESEQFFPFEAKWLISVGVKFKY